MVYEYIVHDSEVEREFVADHIKLFVKFPGWFKIDTPIGKYNPEYGADSE